MSINSHNNNNSTNPQNGLNLNSGRAKIFFAITFAVLGAYISGEASKYAALFLINKYNLSIPIREPLNIIFALIFFNFYRKYGDKNLEYNWGSLISGLFGAILISIILLLAWSFIFLTGSASGFAIKSTESAAMIIVLGVIFMIMHGAAEQLLIQFIAQNISAREYGTRYGIIIGAIAFALLQFLQGYKHPVEIFNSLSIGALMAVLYINFGLFAAICVHAFWSFWEVIVKQTFIDITINHGAIVITGQDSYGSILFGILCIITIFIILKLKQNNLGES